MESGKDRTELVCIIDKSGSMSGYEDDTIGGFNGFIKKQKELPGECHVTTILFDDSLYLLHDRVDIRAMKKMTSHDYVAGGSTALLDAVGMGIDKTVKYVKPSEVRPGPCHFLHYHRWHGKRQHPLQRAENQAHDFHGKGEIPLGFHLLRRRNRREGDGPGNEYRRGQGLQL